MKQKFDERTFTKPKTESIHKLEFPDHWERYEFASQYVNEKRVLDVASGCGYGTALLSRCAGIKATGLDIDREAIAWAKKYYGSCANYELIKDKIWPIKSSSIDVVVSLETLEHILNPIPFLDEIHRVLVSNGVLILSTPHNESESRFSPANPFHLREYSWNELAYLLSHRFVIMSRWSQVSNLSKNWNSVKSSSAGSLFVALKNFLPKGMISYVKDIIISRVKGSYGNIMLGRHDAVNVQILMVYKK
jgi:SAM-dependent methyltransferase